MPALETPHAKLDSKAPSFTLKNVDGKMLSLDQLKGEKGTLIAFICNHCPYVKAQIDRLVHEANELEKVGVKVIAINSNDAISHPEDSFENMQKFAAEKHFPFPYLYDDSQTIAKAYGAVCTPDFLGYNADLKLQYRGRLDESGLGMKQNAKRELFEAMQEIARTGKTTRAQNPSVGCSIKWKAAA